MKAPLATTISSRFSGTSRSSHAELCAGGGYRAETAVETGTPAPLRLTPPVARRDREGDKAMSDKTTTRPWPIQAGRGLSSRTPRTPAASMRMRWIVLQGQRQPPNSGSPRTLSRTPRHLKLALDDRYNPRYRVDHHPRPARDAGYYTNITPISRQVEQVKQYFVEAEGLYRRPLRPRAQAHRQILNLVPTHRGAQFQEKVNKGSTITACQLR